MWFNTQYLYWPTFPYLYGSWTVHQIVKVEFRLHNYDPMFMTIDYRIHFFAVIHGHDSHDTGPSAGIPGSIRFNQVQSGSIRFMHDHRHHHHHHHHHDHRCHHHHHRRRRHHHHHHDHRRHRHHHHHHHHLVGGFNHVEKYYIVNGKDYPIYYGK